MREFKFRAWQDNQMIYFNTIELLWSYESRYKLNADDTLDNGGLLHDDFIDKRYENPILMQYTGLHDMNGKEIYEGDILECRHKTKGRVFFCNGAFRLSSDQCELDPADMQTFDDLNDYLIEDHNLIVVGNIYEHKHLLGVDTVD